MKFNLEVLIRNPDELVEQCIRREVGSYKKLYDKYAVAMYNTCHRIVGNRADAEDVLQEAFIDVFTYLHQFKGTSTVGAWIKRIVVNKSIDWIRKQKISFEELDYRSDFHEDEKAEDNDHNYQVEQVRKEILNLAPGYRAVLSLYLLEGYDHKEIAVILNVSESTTRTQYIRAKAKLRSVLNSNKQWTN